MSLRRRKSSACVSRGEGDLRLFEPVQVVCLESGEAHVVAAGAAVAGGTGGAGNAYFVGGVSNPVTPGRQTHGQVLLLLLS